MLERPTQALPQSSVLHKYRPDVDGLRAVAVLAVIAFHAFPSTVPGGFVGVDIFFVISGYVITSGILQRARQGTFTISDFYSRRIRRIFPALTFVLFSCFLFGWFGLLEDEFRQLGKHIISGALFISNITLWNEAGYFDNTAATKPLLHLWSLGVEEQFYIVWPLVIMVAYRFKLNIMNAIVALIAASFLVNVLSAGSQATFDFYAPVTRFWELMLGALLAQSESRRTLDNDQPKPALSFFGLILLLLGFAVVREGEHFPGWWALIPCVGATLLIESGPDAWVNRNILSNRIAVGIGLISYPLYLWHWPLLSFARIVESANPNINIRMALVTLTFALAAVTYLFIERPIRNSPQIRKNVTALVGAMSLVGLAGLTAFAYNGLGVLRPIDTNMAKVNEQFVGALWKYTSNDACMHRFPYPASKAYGWWFCSLSKDAEPTVLLLGTSFANQLYPGLAHESLLARQNILSIGACDAGMIDAPPAGSSTASLSPCTPERRYDSQGYIDNIVSSANGLKFVIVAGLSATPNAEYISQLQRRIDFLETAGANVIVFTPHIRVNYDVKGCFARPFKRPAQTCHISEDEKKAWDAGFAPLIAAVKKSNPRVQFFDQNILACRSGEGCSIILDGLPLVRDQYQHLSEFGSDRLAALFAEWSKVNAPALLN